MAKQTFTTGQVLTAAQMTSLQQTAMLGGAASTKTASYVLIAADAGTSISMNSASSTTITVNTGLFAAGDIVTLINIGAGTCTITAGTATVTTSANLSLSQYEGGVLYFTSASAAVFFEFSSTSTGDITAVTTAATSGLAGGATSGAVALTLATAAKGDLLVGTAANQASVLTVGANNTLLTADSSTATGLKWSAPSTASFVGCTAYRASTNLSVPSATNTAVTMANEEFDTDAFHSTSTNTSRMTIPSGKNGKYLLLGSISFDNLGIQAQIRWSKNGSTIGNGVVAGITNTTTNIYGNLGLLIVDAVAGDYFEMFAYQINTTVNLTDARFTIVYLGA